MKNYIKYQFIIIIVLIAFLTITACSKKSPDTETVSFPEQTETENGNYDVDSILKEKLVQEKWIYFQPDSRFDSLNANSAIEFLQNGTFSYHYYIGEYLEEGKGTWSIEDTKLSMNTEHYTNGVYRHNELEEYRFCDYLTDEIFSQWKSYIPNSGVERPIYKALDDHNFDFKVEDSGAWGVTENYLYLHQTIQDGLFISEKHLAETEDPETNILINRLTAHPWYREDKKSLNSSVIVKTVFQFSKDGFSSADYISSDGTTDKVAGYWEIHGKYLYIHWDKAMNDLEIYPYSEYLNDDIIAKGTESIESINNKSSDYFWYVSDKYLYLHSFVFYY